MAQIKNSKFSLPITKNSLMALIGGVESGLATTTAIIGGLTVSETSRHVVVVTALISMSVQAWNSAMSRISLETTEDQIDHPYSKTEHYLNYISEAFLQLTSHVGAGLLPIMPIIFVDDRGIGLATSILVTLVMLLLIGINKGRVLKRSKSKSALEMVIPAILVIFIGILAGLFIE